MGQTDLAGFIIFAALGGVWLFGALVLGFFDFSQSRARVDAQGSAEEEARLKKRYNNMAHRRYMILLGSIISFLVGIAFSARWYFIGTITREEDLVTVNWAFFAILSLAAGLTGYVVSVFFELRTGAGKAFMAFSWTVAFVLLSVGSLPHLGDLRMWCFVLSILLQFASVVAIFAGSVQPKVFACLKTYLVLLIIAVGLVFIDTFWAIGLYNEPASMATLNSRFGTQLAILVGGCLPLFLFAPAVATLLYGQEYFNLWDMFTSDTYNDKALYYAGADLSSTI